MWIAKYQQRLILWGLLLCLGAISNYYTARLSLKHQLDSYLGQTLTAHIENALQSSFHDLENRHFIESQINQHFSQLQMQAPAGHFLQCRVNLLNWTTDQPLPADTSQTFTLAWQSGASQQRMQFDMPCQMNWPAWFWWQGLLAGALLALMLVLPLPLSKRQLAWQKLAAPRVSKKVLHSSLPHIQVLPTRQYQWLCDALHHARADAVMECLQDRRFYTLSNVEFDWLLCALKQPNITADEALRIAKSPAELEFIADTEQLTVHGLHVPMAKTPYLYYLWYAQLRCLQHEQGWLLNPPPNKPELASGKLLAEFMRAHQGHPRAINDLQNHGLTPKKLDQNRNRIRESLLSIMDENLAEAFLFESRRDPRSGRFAHRIAVEPHAIRLTCEQKNISSHSSQENKSQ